MTETDPHFIQRKRDHIRIALDPQAQSSRATGLEDVDLIHEALPDLDFSEIDLSSEFNGTLLKAPYFISSMTAGHERGRDLNRFLAMIAERRGLLMGVGSQRRELEDGSAADEWREVRKAAPRAVLAGNIGIAQAIQASSDRIKALVEGLEAKALFVHLNPLQECLQPEGTPQFKGGLQALEKTVKAAGVPVIVKEVGCGFSQETLRRLEGIGVFATDLSGLGGTHWGRVEGQRLPAHDVRAEAAVAFADWGTPTVRSLINARAAEVSYQIWASGGVRDGVGVAKLIALGARFVGLARPWLEAATDSKPEQALERLADRLDFELKTALFCTGCRTPAVLGTGTRWEWRT